MRSIALAVLLATSSCTLVGYGMGAGFDGAAGTEQIGKRVGVRIGLGVDLAILCAIIGLGRH